MVAKVFVMPVAAAHPTAMALQSLCPVAKSNIGELTSHCQGPVRADIVGLLTHVEMVFTAKPKATLWLKDESKEEIAISAWGSRMVSAARDMKVGQLAQIDNCLLHKKLDGSVEGSCEDFLDSDRHSFSHLTTDVAGERAERLRQLDCDRGHAISTPWSLQAGALRMKTDGSEKYVSCAATVAACPLTMQAAVEVVLHGIWVTNVHGSPSYTPCKHCRTKIDAGTQACKKKAEGCASTPNDEVAVLATLDIADHTGCLERVLVGEAALCDLSAAEDKQALLRILDKEGPEGLCFRTQLDIRLATSSSMNKYRPATDSTAATTQQDSQDSDSKASSTTECQFQVLAAQPCLGKAYDAHSRPMIKKVLRLAGSRPEGAVYPVSSVYTDVSYSGMGIKDAGELRRFGDQSDEHVLIQHAQVVPVDAAVAEEEFCVEAMCSFAQCLQYSMSDGTPRLLLGALTREDKAGKVTMVVERMFRVKDEGQVDNLAAERSLVVELQADSAQTTATKRPADALVAQTPSKEGVLFANPGR
ncbi:unnamed protein product [Effrenium voratum]|nr:unnamed protein product [Effrenium voratum]